MRLRISGFTLMELIITILVMTILLGIGVPSYLKFKEDNLLQGAAQSLHADIQFARSEAIKRSSDVTVYFLEIPVIIQNGAIEYRIMPPVKQLVLILVIPPAMHPVIFMVMV